MNTKPLINPLIRREPGKFRGTARTSPFCCTPAARAASLCARAAERRRASPRTAHTLTIFPTGVTRAAGSQRVPCVRRPRACAAAAAGGDAPSSAAGAAGADGSCAAAPPPPPPAPRGPRTAAAVAAERRAKFAPPAADRAAAADGGGASTSGRPPAPWGTGSSGGQQRPGAAPAAARPGGRGVPAAQDKTRLTADESADIARRLRAAGGGPAAGRAAPLRLYR